MIADTIEHTGHCPHCRCRVLVRRRRGLFPPWRCTVCGSVVKAVGDNAVAWAEKDAARAAYPVQGAAVATVRAYRWMLAAQYSIIGVSGVLGAVIVALIILTSR